MRAYALPLRRRVVVDRDAARTMLEWYAPRGKGWTLYLWPRTRLTWYVGRTLGGWNIDLGPVEVFLRRKGAASRREEP